ncbi:hypothetical protein HYH02_006675 [Chlamydomonas schloesseri]|uniref:Protein kinase domain-containing protein n=1 Tax=Chlamydomonas schloesseri TaxID=2026947 RepID=A0A835T582_9CHLO|nr:hypothetical protein HYH02_006675 [Chlamydomonas schloesseri]|eukprot:KAG2432690.1 hypothetical protein HYH02_006675 [Chlamydomonas schloesseri]
MQAKLHHTPAARSAAPASARRVAPSAPAPAPAAAIRRSVAAGAATGGAAATSVAAMSSQMRGLRSKMEEDEQLRVLMAGFRGANLNEDDFASSNVRMELIETDSDSDHQLPLTYDVDAISRYWDRRPVSVITRITQLLGISGKFLTGLAVDAASGRLRETEVQRAIQLRDIVTSLGPAYIKLGQALSIRPDLLSPAAMNELQKLCDKVPSFDNKLAMQVINEELGAPWYEVFAELTPEPIAAASLGQVYKGRLKTGETVAVKVQRPYVLETVTIDLYIIRRLGLFLRRFPQVTTDVVALLDEWAARFFEELDYVHEGANSERFAEQMRLELPQVVVPRTYFEYTSRRVLTTEWLEGEKLSQSKADDVGTLVNVGVICYLKQLLETGFFHADPHPGNLIRTPDGRLAILDFGLMTQVDDDIKYGMIEAISHLIHRDYEAIVKDFVTLDFIPEGTDLRPILPVLAKVFDQALEGGGAKNINFQELAADLAQITFDYPFRIPPYFALIIRAIGVLEGIALVGNPDFALVDEAYPYIAKRLLTDDSPRLRAALKYMVYGRDGVFDAERLIDLLGALEQFVDRSQTAMGDLSGAPAGPTASLSSMNSFSSLASADGADADAVVAAAAAAADRRASGAGASSSSSSSSGTAAPAAPQQPLGFPFPPPPPFGFPFPFPFPAPATLGLPGGGFGLPGSASDPANAGGGALGAPAMLDTSSAGLLGPLAALLPPPLAASVAAAIAQQSAQPGTLSSIGGLSSTTTGAGMGGAAQLRTRAALRFIFSPEGSFFRDFMMDELVKSIDALSREQAIAVITTLGLQNAMVPVLLPGASRAFLPLTPSLTEEDRRVVENVTKIAAFLGRGSGGGLATGLAGSDGLAVAGELLPVMPAVATEIVPQLAQRLASRVTARAVREILL